MEMIKYAVYAVEFDESVPYVLRIGVVTEVTEDEILWVNRNYFSTDTESVIARLEEQEKAVTGLAADNLYRCVLHDKKFARMLGCEESGDMDTLELYKLFSTKEEVEKFVKEYFAEYARYEEKVLPLRKAEQEHLAEFLVKVGIYFREGKTQPSECPHNKSGEEKKFPKRGELKDSEIITLGWNRVVFCSGVSAISTAHYVLSDGYEACTILREINNTSVIFDHRNTSKLLDEEPVDWVFEINESHVDAPGELTNAEAIHINFTAYIPCRICRAAAKEGWTPEYAEKFIQEYKYGSSVQQKKRREELKQVLGE